MFLTFNQIIIWPNVLNFWSNNYLNKCSEHLIKKFFKKYRCCHLLGKKCTKYRDTTTTTTFWFQVSMYRFFDTWRSSILSIPSIGDVGLWRCIDTSILTQSYPTLAIMSRRTQEKNINLLFYWYIIKYIK